MPKAHGFGHFLCLFLFSKINFETSWNFLEKMAKVGISQKSEKIEKNLRKLMYFTDFDNKLYHVYNKCHFKQ